MPLRIESSRAFVGDAPCTAFEYTKKVGQHVVGAKLYSPNNIAGCKEKCDELDECHTIDWN